MVETPWAANMNTARQVCSMDSSFVRMSDNGSGQDDGVGDARTGIVTKTRPKTKKPSLYKVLLLNDDYTPMEFVVYVLERFFNKGPEEATRIMLHVHQRGVGICGSISTHCNVPWKRSEFASCPRSPPV